MSEPESPHGWFEDGRAWGLEGWMSSVNSTSQALTTTVVVEDYLHGVSVEAFLIRHFRNYTIWRVQRLVMAGCVTINDMRTGRFRRVRRGDRVTIRLVEPPDKLHKPEDMNLEIVYEDPWFIVVNKPVNIAAHPVGLIQSGTLVNGLQAYLDQKSKLRGLVRPGIVHRLDRMTTGLMVTTKDHNGHRLISADFEHGNISKSYLAIVHGVVENDSGTIDRPVGPRPGSILMTTESGARWYKDATTDYRVLERFKDRTLVHVVPKTGRVHQIRVHFSSVGHPLIGDEFYGFGEPTSKRPGNARHALHAAVLSFTHPMLKRRMVFRSELPPDMRAMLPAPH